MAKKLTSRQTELLKAMDGYRDVLVRGELKQVCIRLAQRGLVKIKTQCTFSVTKGRGRITPHTYATVTAAGRKAVA